MLTEQLGWICRAEACLCAAARGAADVLDRLRSLTPAPGGQTGPEKRRTIVLRGLVELVNAGHYRLARELAEAEHVQEAPLAVAESRRERPKPSGMRSSRSPSSICRSPQSRPRKGAIRPRPVVATAGCAPSRAAAVLGRAPG